MKSKPCLECPFRKKSLPGWIGAHSSIHEIIDIVDRGQKFPCHLLTNAAMERQEARGEERDFERACNSAPHCVGALAFLANKGDGSPSQYIEMQSGIVGRRSDVFKTVDEMEKHHEKFGRK